MSEQAFFAIHSDLPREGPDDRASLDRALPPEADAKLATAIAELRKEIDIWRAHGDSFGYAMCVVAG